LESAQAQSEQQSQQLIKVIKEVLKNKKTINKIKKKLEI
jgi:hypothetical protein